jgi:hypothetical protein
MKPSINFIIVLSISILLAANNRGRAQTLKAAVKDLAFMAGTWTQQHAWGDMEEFWGEPMGNSMVSSYRCVKDGKIIFYEFVVIEDGEDGPVLRLRHFNPGSIGWEDKNTPLLFPLVQVENNTAVFETVNKSLKMTYRVAPKSKMDILLEEKNKDGNWVKTIFNFVYKN